MDDYGDATAAVRVRSAAASARLTVVMPTDIRAGGRRVPVSPVAMTKPPRLRRGDTIGVVAPGGAVVDRAALERGVGALEALGYRVVLGASVGARRGYLAGSEELRRDDLVRMFETPEVRAIFCARGGYGVTRLLPLVDPAALARQAKIFVGYSDVSPLLVGLVQRGGMVAFHGPMVSADLGRAAAIGGPAAGPAAHGGGLDEQSTRQLLDMLTGAGGATTLAVPQVVHGGTAQGTLVGGCLSLLAATVGTRYALRAEGSVLFLEDVGEPAYRIDRMLTQLRQSGVLDGVRGIVFGAMTGCGAVNGGPSGIEMALGDLADALGVPVGAGLPSGHGRPNMTLPFGVRAELVLEGGTGVLRLEEAAVV